MSGAENRPADPALEVGQEAHAVYSRKPSDPARRPRIAMPVDAKVEPKVMSRASTRRSSFHSELSPTATSDGGAMRERRNKAPPDQETRAAPRSPPHLPSRDPSTASCALPLRFPSGFLSIGRLHRKLDPSTITSCLFFTP